MAMRALTTSTMARSTMNTSEIGMGMMSWSVVMRVVPWVVASALATRLSLTLLACTHA